MVNRSIAGEEYFRKLNFDDDPFQNGYSGKIFFTTAELQHRLDLIKHLLEFSQQLILIKGIAKVGKTSFAQHLMASSGDNWLICRIDATGDIDPDTLVKTMLSEYQAGIDDGPETISLINKYLEYCYKNDKTPVLVIDNADKLNPTTLGFIFQLVEFREQNRFIRVVLIGSDLLSQKLNKISEENLAPGIVHEVNIPVFSLEETAAYLRFRLGVCGGPEDIFSEKEISRIHKVSVGVAGDINFLAKQGLIDPAELKPETSGLKTTEKFTNNILPIGSVVIGALLVTFMLLSSWSYFRKDDHLKGESKPLRLPAEALTTGSNLPEELILQETLSAADDTRGLPLPVEIPQELKLQIRQQGPGLQPEKEINSADEPGSNVLEPVKELLTASSKAASSSEIRGNDWLLRQPDDGYVIQLIGALEMATINRFIQLTEIDTNELALYQTLKSNENWYVLVYGLYDSREQARVTMNTLSAEVRAGKPWLKAMTAIHAEIKVGQRP
jgi:type II secretory pathway predicted ATPase ExeA